MEITDKNTEKIKLVPFAVIQKAVEGDIVSDFMSCHQIAHIS